MRRITILALTAVTAAVFASLASAGPTVHRHDMATMGGTTSQALATQLADARVATAKYANNLALAKKQGYGVITQMIPDMGWHFMNPKITAFDVTKPPILVYGKRGSAWQLVAFEWVFPKKPAKPPLPGATYGSFGAACHYKDGTFVFQADQNACAPKSPQQRGGLRVLAPRPRDDARLGVVPEPRGGVLRHEPADAPFQQGLAAVRALCPLG